MCVLFGHVCDILAVYGEYEVYARGPVSALPLISLGDIVLAQAALVGPQLIHCTSPSATMARSISI